MKKANYIQWIEQQIVKFQELGGMELEIWAFIQCLKKARQLGEHLNTPSVVGQSEQLVCDKCNEEGWITENKGDILEHKSCDCDKVN